MYVCVDMAADIAFRKQTKKSLYILPNVIWLTESLYVNLVQNFLGYEWFLVLQTENEKKNCIFLISFVDLLYPIFIVANENCQPKDDEYQSN